MQITVKAGMRVEWYGKEILIVDDEKAIRDTLSDYLEDEGCLPVVAANGIEALDIIHAKLPDGMIVDLNMPMMDGFELINIVSSEFPEMPIIALSGVGILDKAVDSMRKGAWDFLSKPLISMKVLMFSLQRVFERTRLLRENRLYKEHLEAEVDRKTRQVLALNESMITTQTEIIMRLGDVVETRSHETGNHVLRVSELAYRMSQLAGVEEETAREIKVASPMHDVGKIGISDLILNKPGALTPEERQVMETHTTIGYYIFKPSKLPILQLAAEISRDHHERWDGQGYPNKRKGLEIPFSARVTCIVDVFDAVSHARVYKPAWDLDRSLAYIAENKGTMFDPVLVDLFLTNKDQFLEIFHRYED